MRSMQIQTQPRNSRNLGRGLRLMDVDTCKLPNFLMLSIATIFVAHNPVATDCRRANHCADAMYE